MIGNTMLTPNADLQVANLQTFCVDLDQLPTTDDGHARRNEGLAACGRSVCFPVSALTRQPASPHTSGQTARFRVICVCCENQSRIASPELSCCATCKLGCVDDPCGLVS